MENRWNTLQKYASILGRAKKTLLSFHAIARYESPAPHISMLGVNRLVKRRYIKERFFAPSGTLQKYNIEIGGCGGEATAHKA